MGSRGPKSAAELAIPQNDDTKPGTAQLGPIDPPRPLGEHGKRLWDDMTNEFDFASPGAAEVLAQACAAIDLAELAKGEGDRKNELQARAFATRTILRLCDGK